MEDPLSDVEIDEGFDANEEPQPFRRAQSDEELFDYSDKDEEEEEPIDIDPNDPEWNPENNPFDEDEDGESEETQTASISQPSHLWTNRILMTMNWTMI